MRSRPPGKDKLASWAHGLQPLVERVVGSSFHSFPTVRTASRQEVSDILTEELLPHTCIAYRLPKGDIARDITRPKAEQIANGLVGKYWAKQHAILILPEVLEVMAQIFHEDVFLSDDFVRLLLTHECVHALDEQDHHAIERSGSPSSMEESLMWDAVLEGHAQYQTERVARELGLLELFKTHERFIHASNPSLSEAEQYRDQWVGRYRAFSYIQGRTFFEFQSKRDPQYRKTIFSMLPSTRRMILHPESYPEESGRPRGRDLADLWKTCTEEVDDRFHTVIPLSEYDLKHLVHRYLPNVSGELFGKFVRGELCAIEDGTGPLGDKLYCSVWQGADPSWAESAKDVLVALLKAKDSAWKAGEGKVVGSTYCVIELKGSVSAVQARRYRSIEGVRRQYDYVLAAFGECLIWLTASNGILDESEMRETAEEVVAYLRTP